MEVQVLDFLGVGLGSGVKRLVFKGSGFRGFYAAFLGKEMFYMGVARLSGSLMLMVSFQTLL